MLQPWDEYGNIVEYFFNEKTNDDMDTFSLE